MHPSVVLYIWAVQGRHTLPPFRAGIAPYAPVRLYACYNYTHVLSSKCGFDCPGITRILSRMPMLQRIAHLQLLLRDCKVVVACTWKRWCTLEQSRLPIQPPQKIDTRTRPPCVQQPLSCTSCSNATTKKLVPPHSFSLQKWFKYG